MAASVLTKESGSPQGDHGRRLSDVGLDALGITQASNVYWNLTTPELYEEIARRNEGILSDHGALIVDTGEHTGRAAKDKAIVRELGAKRRFSGATSTKTSRREKFNALRDRMMAHTLGANFSCRTLSAALTEIIDSQCASLTNWRGIRSSRAPCSSAIPAAPRQHSQNLPSSTFPVSKPTRNATARARRRLS